MGNTSGKVKEQSWPCPALGLPPGGARCLLLPICPSICTAPKWDRGRLSTALRCAGTGALSFGWPREIVHYHTQTNTPVTLLLNTAKHGSNITRTGVVLRLTTEGRKCTGVVEGDP